MAALHELEALECDGRLTPIFTARSMDDLRFRSSSVFTDRNIDRNSVRGEKLTLRFSSRACVGL